MDDGGGAMSAWEAVRVMHELGLRPRRTVRVVLWTNEENGLAGGRGYEQLHHGEWRGTFSPSSLIAARSSRQVFRS